MKQKMDQELKSMWEKRGKYDISGLNTSAHINYQYACEFNVK